MPHALTANLFGGDVHAAFFALVHLLAVGVLVLAAHTGAVLGRPEDALAEESSGFGLERPVVDGLGLGHLAVRPLPDHIRRRQSDFN